jgi:hypothetical protein
MTHPVQGPARNAEASAVVSLVHGKEWFMAEDIFISYRRADTDAIAGRIRDHLANLFPNRVFLDVDSVSAGADFLSVVLGVISHCKLVIVIIGPHWVRPPGHETRLGDEQDFVTMEVSAALELNVTVVPVVVGGAALPALGDLPPKLRDLTRRNAVRVTHERFRQDMQDVEKLVYRTLGLKPPTAWELFLQDFNARIPVIGGEDIRISSEKTRNLHAIIALITGAGLFIFCGAAALTGQIPRGITEDDPMGLILMFAVTGYALTIGFNSARYRRLAVFGLVLVVLAASSLVYLATRMPWRG